MGARHDICEIVKRAQTWGYYPPAHGEGESETYSDLLKAPFKALGSIGGSILGSGMAMWDAAKQNGVKSVVPWFNYVAPFGIRSNSPAPSWKEMSDSWSQIGKGAYEGAKAGWNESDRVKSDLDTASARVLNNFGLVSDKKLSDIRLENDRQILESIRRANIPVPENPPMDPQTGLLVPTGNPDYEWYDKSLNLARAGNGFGTGFGTAAAMLAGGKVLGTAGKALGNAAKMAPANVEMLSMTGASLPTMTATAKGVSNDVNEGYKEEGADVKAIYDRDAALYESMDPASSEAAALYETLKANASMSPETFKKLKPPSAHGGGTPQVASGSRQDMPQEAPSAESRAGARWSMSPEAQNAAALYGIGGLGLGSLVGGWKLGLLGLLLGALHGGVGLGNIWNRIMASRQNAS